MSYTKYKVRKKLELDNKFNVYHIGMDSSNRPILFSPRMWGAWLSVMERLPDKTANEIDIVQGAWMKFLGGGADASAGYHDLSSCIDTRTWDIDSKEERAVIRAGRSEGWAVWRRDQQHGGFDEHMHWTLLDEPHSAFGAQTQWTSYRNGGDGMGGNDYHWRPDPIPVFNFEKWKKENQLPDIEDLMKHEVLGEQNVTVADALRKAVHADEVVTKLSKRVNVIAGNTAERDRALAELINTIADTIQDAAKREQLKNVGNALTLKLDHLLAEVTDGEADG